MSVSNTSLKVSPDRITVAGLLLDFVEQGLASGRYRNRKQMAGRVRLLAPLDGDLSALTPSRIARFFADFERGPARHGGPRSASNVQLHFGILKAALTWAVSEGLLARSPMPPRLRLVISRDAIDPLERDQNRVTSPHVGQLISDTRIRSLQRTLYMFAAFTGARPGEVIELRHRDLKTDNYGDLYWVLSRQYQANEREIRATKTGVTRAVPLHPALVERIQYNTEACARRYGRAPEPGDLVFPSSKYLVPRHISTHSLSRWLEKDLAMLGARRRTFHTLRATFISRLIVELKQPALLVEWITHRTASTAQGGPVVGGYTRGVYEDAKKMVFDLHYPETNAAQIDFGF